MCAASIARNCKKSYSLGVKKSEERANFAQIPRMIQPAQVTAQMAAQVTAQMAAQASANETAQITALLLFDIRPTRPSSCSFWPARIPALWKFLELAHAARATPLHLSELILVRRNDEACVCEAESLKLYGFADCALLAEVG